MAISEYKGDGCLPPFPPATNKQGEPDTIYPTLKGECVGAQCQGVPACLWVAPERPLALPVPCYGGHPLLALPAKDKMI